MGKMCVIVENCVEKLWGTCGIYVKKYGGFPHNKIMERAKLWEKLGLYTFFNNSCGTISTWIVNKFFNINRGKVGYCGSFAQFPHSLLL